MIMCAQKSIIECTHLYSPINTNSHTHIISKKTATDVLFFLLPYIPATAVRALQALINFNP